MAVVREFLSLTKKYQDDYGENTILIMQVGSFMECYGLYDIKTDTLYGSKIEDFCRICDLNYVPKNTKIDNIEVYMAGFKDFLIEKYVKKIQDAGYIAVVYMQDEAAKNTTRSLAGIFSPGTYFPIETNKLTNNLTSIWIQYIDNKLILKGKYVVVGISNIDIYTGKTNIFQFKETYINNPTTYDQLENFISIFNPSEVIIISNLPLKEINDIINYSSIKCNAIHKICLEDQKANLNNENPINEIHKKEEKQQVFKKRAKNCEKQSYQKEVLTKFYKIDDFDIFIQNFNENNIATQSFCFLLDFVYQHNQYLVNKVSEPIFENVSNKLILANHSLKQLNIIDDDNYSGKYSSILKMLNISLTPMGKRKFAYNFLNPTTDVEYLKREYNITEYFLSKYDKYSDFFRKSLHNIKDISKYERQVFIKKITPKSFYQLYNNINIIKELYNQIKDDNDIFNYLINNDNTIKNTEYFCNNVNEFITKNINIDIAKEVEQGQSFENNFINEGVDALLDNKVKTLVDSESKLEVIRYVLSSIIEGKDKKSKTTDFVKIHETEKNNYSLLCTSRRCTLLKDALPVDEVIKTLEYEINGIKNIFDFKLSKNRFEFIKQSSSNNSIVDEQIRVLCKNITNVKLSLKDTILTVYNKILESFEDYQDQINTIISFVTIIDLLYTKATIAKNYNYCKPTIAESNKSFINAKKMRHCLIEQLQNNELYVSNDIVIGNGLVDGILLYGTNAVGKTSFIKAIGISLIMAQSGLYVPCSEFIYKPYNYIFTRILGNDNIFKGLSTFAVEMSELRTILRLSDENSLILGDELCSGTENVSAVSIFVAGIQKLYEKKCSFIFATHLHEIVNYEEIQQLSSLCLKHMEVIYDKENDILVYDRKLKDGPGNSMYGLEVCKSLSLPQDFLDMAYNIRTKYNPETSSLLSLKPSHYNQKKIMSICEKCNINIGTEVHHLHQQKDANIDGFINNDNNSTFHKNNLANLMTLCEKCHDDIHKNNTKLKKVKTTKGYKVKEVN